MAHGQGGSEIGFDRSPTLTCNHEAPIAAYVTHSLRGEGFDASEDGTGRGTPLVAIQESQSGMRYTGQQHATLDSHNGSRRHHGVQAGSLVRRLTPLECERLQALPPGWTCLCQPLAAYAADPDAAALACRCPDSPRYRALGNAVTTNVVFWLGERLLWQCQKTNRNTALNIALNTAPESD
jgi:DNA (cytosine-5)-methyltransferase 1